MPNRQKGFSALILIIALTIIAALSFAGWYVWSKNKDDSANINTAQQTETQTQPTQNVEPEKPADPTEGGKYLVIKEWGVRIELPGNLQGDVEYGIRKSVILNDYPPDEAPIYGQIAYFTSDRLASMGDDGGQNCKLKPGAHDDLHSRDDPDNFDGGLDVILVRSPEDLSHEPGAYKQVGSYWYRSETSKYQVSCYEGSDYSKESAFIVELINAMDTLEKY